MFKIHYWNATEPCFLESMAKPCLTRKCIVCGVISYANYFSTTWLLKQIKQILANKENFYWPNRVETFLKWKTKAIYDRKTLGKKAKPWVEIVTSLTPGNLIVSSATSVSFKDAGGGWNSSRKRTMTYIVVKRGQRHKKWKVKRTKVCDILKALGISRVL